MAAMASMASAIPCAGYLTWVAAPVATVVETADDAVEVTEPVDTSVAVLPVAVVLVAVFPVAVILVEVVELGCTLVLASVEVSVLDIVAEEATLAVEVVVVVCSL